MKLKKFSEITLQPLIIFGNLLEEAFSDCCVRKPCVRGDENEMLDLNMDYRGDSDTMVVYLTGELYLYGFHYMITRERYLYMKRYNTFIIVDFHDNRDEDENNIILITLGYGLPQFDFPLSRWGITDKEDVEERTDKIIGRFKDCEMPILGLDNPTFISKMNKFLKLKIESDEEFEKIKKEIFDNSSQ